MANPQKHAKSSVKRWGGKIEDYIFLHKNLDFPKSCMNNNTARALTHNTWYIYEIIPQIFGYTITNSDGRQVDTIDIAMLHVLEDFHMKFIPTPQDYLKHLELQDWMNNGVKCIDSQDALNLASTFKQKINE